MMDFISASTMTHRAGLLAIAVSLHVGLFALSRIPESSPTRRADPPLMLEFVDAKPMAASASVPQSRPKPVPPATLSKPTMPRLEASASALPAQGDTPSAAPVVSSSAELRTGQGAVGTADPPVSLARFDADYLKNPAPPYPPMSRRLGEEGRVILRARVSAEGVAEAVEIKTSSGSVRLDEAAQRTVRTWRFVAAKRTVNGLERPVESWVLVPVVFRLEH